MRKKGRHLKATDLARKLWRTVGYCEYCGKTRNQVQLQGAHIFGVGAYPRLRDDLRNGLSLCASDHRRFTSDPIAFTDWIRTTKYAKYFPDLKAKNLIHKKRFWDERLEELRGFEKQLERGEVTLDELREKES